MKKTVLRKMFCIFLACVLACTAVFPALADTPAEDAHLHFNEDGKFRILNFSDFQDGPELNAQVKTFIRRAVYSALPDLIVLTGDNIYGRHVSGTDQSQTAIAEFMDIFEELGVPVAIVFGNHDDDGSAASKEAQMAFYNSYSVSVSYDEGDAMSGCGTYNVPIYGSVLTDKVQFNLWMLDTGSASSHSLIHYDRYDGVQYSQLNWYVSKSNALKAANGGEPVPSIAFQHIIVPEIYSALDVVPSGTPGAQKHDGKYYALPATAAPGGILGEAPCPTVSSRYCGEFSKMKSQGDVLAIVCGHDHRNMFEVPYQGIDLICTPSAGFYHGYGYSGSPESRGARIIDIDESGGYSTSMLLLRDLNWPNPQYYVPTSAANKYVQNVALCMEHSAQHGGSTKAAMAAAYRRMYAAVDAANGNGVALWADLNSDVGHSTLDSSPDDHVVICMGYTLTDNPDEAIRRLGLCYDSYYLTWYGSYCRVDADKHIWYPVNLIRDRKVDGTDGCVNLNAGTTGNRIYFFTHYNLTESPMTEIRIVNTGADDTIRMSAYPDDQLAYAVIGSETGPDVADLNKTAWGDYIYALYRTADNSMNRVKLDTQPLLEARFHAIRHLQALDTDCSAEGMAALQNALAQADAILHDLDDNETSVYNQAAIDAAVYRLVNAEYPERASVFTVTFDANGGSCAEQSRTIVYGDFCGKLPVAKKNRSPKSSVLEQKSFAYIFGGWYTEREGGERITAKTIYTAASDQTWYAHWVTPEAIEIVGHKDIGDKDKWESIEISGLDLEFPYKRVPDHEQYIPDKADINTDGTVDLKDITLLTRHLAGGWNVEVGFENADINADGKIDLRDVVLLRRYLAGGWGVVLV